MISNYDRAVQEAKYCKAKGLSEEDALQKIQNMIEYGHPIPGCPGELARMIWQEAAVKTDRDLMLHCPKHGSQPNNINIVEYNGDRDIFCWCGNLLAIVRGGKMYAPCAQGGDENDN